MSECVEAQRIDLWLWHARFYKTRSLATATVAKGRIRVTSNGLTRRISKPATLVRAGDTLTLLRNGSIVGLTILALAERRGNATQAQALYQLPDEAQPDAGSAQGRRNDDRVSTR
ncbi:RNA-binding S4 domain-containing protein [Maricaulis sp.]|uniref:RNA-binding S4 domain-containing protein n=1 Tax=Maricaulis sp. TaxID=1486257 RepID=UPI003A94FD8C